MLIGHHRYTEARRAPTVEPDDDAVKKFYMETVSGLDIKTADLVKALQEEIPSVADLAYMTSEDLDSVKTSLATSTKDSNGNPSQSFKLSFRSLKRLKALSKAVTFLSRTRRDITAEVLVWQTLEKFEIEYDALVKNAAAPEPEVPKYNKNKGWLVYRQDMLKFLCRVYGSQLAPLAYLIIPDTQRDDTLPGDSDYPKFLSGRLYSSKHPRIVAELLARAPRNTADAEQDAEALYNHIAESLKGTPAESLLEEFHKSKDGVGLWHRIAETQCTSSAYEAACKKHLNYLMTGTWSGSQDGQLDVFVDKQRRQYELYDQARQQCGAQSFNGQTRVGWMLDGIKSKDPNIVVRVQAIRDDETGKRVDFESAATYLSTCEYEGKGENRKKRKPPSEPAAELSSVKGGGGGGKEGLSSDSYQEKLDFSGGRGPKTGIALRWYPKPEFNALTKEERKEIIQWRATTGVSAKSQRQAKKQKKKEKGGKVSAAKASKAISDIASIAANMPEGDHRSKIESILAESGADVGSMTIDQSSPAGEDVEQPSMDQSGNEVVAEVGGSAVGNVSGDKVETFDEVRKEVEESVAVAAALGTQRIVKLKSKNGGKSGEKSEED